MRHGSPIALVLLLAADPTLALTGREVIDTAQEKHGFSTWHDRTLSAIMENYEHGTLVRTRELDITEQTDPRGDQSSLSEFMAPTDVPPQQIRD